MGSTAIQYFIVIFVSAITFDARARAISDICHAAATQRNRAGKNPRHLKPVGLGLSDSGFGFGFEWPEFFV